MISNNRWYVIFLKAVSVNDGKQYTIKKEVRGGRRTSDFLGYKA